MTKRGLELILMFLASTVKLSYCQRFQLGSCPTVTPTAPFVASALSGTWYEYARTPSLHDHGLRCTSVTFSITDTNLESSLSTITFQSFKATGGTPVTAAGYLYFPNTQSVGLISVTIPASFLKLFPTKYTVLNYADDPQFVTLYSCKNIGIGRLENIILLVGTRPPITNEVNAAISALTTAGISTDLKYIDQSNC